MSCIVVVRFIGDMLLVYRYGYVTPNMRYFYVMQAIIFN